MRDFGEDIFGGGAAEGRCANEGLRAVGTTAEEAEAAAEATEAAAEAEEEGVGLVSSAGTDDGEGS
jgi:hypothetical protein